ncbi:hypothetical protein ACRAWD_19045 [Caulobacter segnis]
MISMHRRKFDAAGRIVNTHGDYPQAVRDTAKDLRVPLIDLHAMSAAFYEALGSRPTPGRPSTTAARTPPTTTITAPTSWPGAWSRASGPMSPTSPRTFCRTSRRSISAKPPAPRNLRRARQRRLQPGASPRGN